MTADEFNNLVTADIRRIMERCRKQYDEDQQAAFLERYVANRSKPEFREPRETYDYSADYEEEKMLDSRERSKDINSCR